MTLAPQELAPQLIRLFYTAGLLDDDACNTYAARHKKHKPILSVLTQDAFSLDTFRDLLFAEITFKAKAGKVDPALHEGLTHSSLVHNDELEALLAAYRPPIDRLMAALRADGALDADREARWAQWLESTTRREPASLVAEGLLDAATVNQWLSRRQSRAIEQAAMFLSLYVLRFNELISAADLERLKQTLAEGNPEPVRAWVRDAAQLPPPRLRERVEAGLAFPSQSLEGFLPTAGLMGRLPQSLVRRHLFLPLAAGERTLEVAASDPFNVPLIALLRWVGDVWVQPRFAPSQAIIDRINAYYRPQAAPVAPTKPALRPAAAPPPSAPPPPAEPAPREVESVADNVSAVQIVSTMVENAIALRATDIHIEPTRRGMLVRYRIDGELQKIMTIPPSLAQPVVSRVKVLADMDVTERRRPQDGHFELDVENNHFDFRISTLPVVHGEKVVVRILEASRVLKGFDELGLYPEQQKTLEAMVRQPYGMILVTGPTGSGKTSTLYSAMNLLNRERRNLVTIEDPVEYQLEGINQVQVDPHVGLTFSEGLRAVLRQDPDVIMVGEIRDADTARNAIRAAMTGHLVLTTLHTNTALGAVDALVHLGAMPFMLAGSLLGVVNQRLVRVLCAQCRRRTTLTAAVARQLGLPEGSRKRIWAAVGCEQCFKTGYLGRTGVFEVLRVSDALRAKIAAHAPLADMEHVLREDKVLRLQEAGVRKVLDGITTAEEAAEKIMLDAQ